MAMLRAQFRKELEPGLNTVFGLEYDRYPEEWKEMFEVTRSRKAWEEDVLVAGFRSAPTKAEGAGVEYDSASEAWTARYTHETIALAFSITEEAQDDNLYGNIGEKYSKALARSMVNAKEVKGAGIFNNGFSGSYVGGDGVSLFSTAHPLVGGGVLSNKLATPADLSETALEDAINQIGTYTDERGIPVMTEARKLIVPVQLQFEASRILNSPYRTGTTDNDISAMKEMGMIAEGYRVNHRLTDPDGWFLITDCPDGLKHFVRTALTTATEGEFNTGNIRYKTSERYSFGWTDPRGAFGSEGV